MSEERPRNVGSPTGESTYREVMYRSEFADGTVVDGEPVNADEPAPIDWEMLSFKKRPKPVRVIRYERSVTVYATEWVPVPSEDQSKPLGES
jgi:hypothetical protein